MLHAQRYVQTRSWSPFVGHVLSSSEANSLVGHLRKDASTLATCAAISIADAIRGIESGFFSWATVKLYYSIFYCYRSILASNRFCVIYEDRKPRTLQARAGSACATTKGTTHQVVIASFSKEFSAHWLLGQDIDLKKPPLWLMDLREEANYKRGSFWEPDCPPHFQALKSLGVRRAVDGYLKDKMLAFDPDHAALAYPLQAIIEARSKLQRMDERDADFLQLRAKDARGPLSELIRQLIGK
jgi:hypothetical protein